MASHRVIQLDLTTNKVIATISQEGEGPGELLEPELVWVEGEVLWVSRSENRRVHRFGLDGSFRESVPVRGAGILTGRLDDRWGRQSR